MLYIIGFFILFCMVMSLRALFYPSRWKEHHVSLHHFLFLGMCYITIMIGFGLLFMLLEIEGIQILVEAGRPLSGDFLDHFFTTMYFSGITLFSVGYGDVTPVGIGRGIALIESWLGYTIPAAFVVKSFLHYENK
ncbi:MULTISPECIES: ion channel [Rossellomorea]|uniref:Transporter n=2 Tax=Rossellomorea vietnamensis TaxID=218284 RepID=A0A0N8GGK4_9BACI|nr:MULTISPECIES: ion channel [Rossellomorea]KPL58746.1 transporter [Rossellomorea vietnamensis]MCA0149221.1 potassium channel family protein [Rossellomorea vietnamensis]MCC5801162.1 two pore domain potassium channel family protein [Rossellomorea vietnamensis]UTE78902.1 potassium channel family protein [Rossellomorea sp. KS-H15a]UXH45976.1 potassium channel family protein [Rossellomorea vietnamensis]